MRMLMYCAVVLYILTFLSTTMLARQHAIQKDKEAADIIRVAGLKVTEFIQQ